MYTVEEIKDILKIRLSGKRYTHSLNVAESAKKLADVYCEDMDKAYLAGLIHDICKEIPKDEQLDMVKKSDRDICPSELITPALYHAPAGAWYAENALGIHDEDILNAVRYHTIARAGMSPLEEIIYLADLISADRSYKDVGRMRRLAFIDMKQAMLAALKFSVCDVVEKGSQLPVHTVEAYNRYSMKKERKE